MKKILFVLMIGFGLIGCQRDYTFTDTERPASPTDDSTLLIKYVEVDSIPGAAPDSSFVSFSYDNFGRLASTYIVYSTDSIENSSYYYLSNYFYNNIDSFPSEIISVSVEGNTTDFDTSHTFYNSAGQVVLDSTTQATNNGMGSSGLNISVKKYDYVNSSIIRKATNYFIAPGFSTSSSSIVIDTFSQTFQNGNLIKQYSATHSPFGMVVTDLNYTYDSHPNPFYSLKGSNNNPVSEYDEESINFSQKNNCTKVIQSMDTAFSNINCTYQYRLNGLPSLVNKIISESGSITTVRGIYTYGRR